MSWTNGDAVAHTVTFNNGPDCGNLAPAASITVTFPGQARTHITARFTRA